MLKFQIDKYVVHDTDTAKQVNHFQTFCKDVENYATSGYEKTNHRPEQQPTTNRIRIQVNGSRQICFARCIVGTCERREIQCRIHGKCKQ